MVYTVSKGKQDIQVKALEFNFLESNNLTPLDMYIGLSQVFVSN